MATIRDKIAAKERAHTVATRLSLYYYLDNVIINANPKPARFSRVVEPWQRELYASKIPMFEALAGLRPDYAGPWSFCDILARGHDKTSMEGRLATWLLLASKRQINGYILAADADQGGLVLGAIEEETRLNPWVARQIKIVKGGVRGPAGTVEVVPADAAGAWGFRGNFYLFDEWTNWRKPTSREVWKAVYSGTEKITPRVLGIASNAGFLGSWQHAVYEGFRTNKDMVVWDKPGQLASWMSPERIAELRKGLPPSEAARVFDNKWIDVGEDAGYLTEEEAKACVDTAMTMRLGRRQGVGNYCLFVDYGPKRDRTVFLVAHATPEGSVVVDRCDVWTGVTPVGRVGERIDSLIAAFHPALILIDPFQTLGIIEALRARMLPVEEVEFRSGRLNKELADTLRTAVASQRVAWYPGCGTLPDGDTLEQELGRLVTKRKAYGYRFDHEATGHDDRAFCLALACRYCPGVV